MMEPPQNIRNGWRLFPFASMIQTAILLIAVGGGVFSAYANLQSEITALAINFAKLQQQQDESRTRITEEQVALAALTADVRARLDQISQQLYELRGLIAGQKDGKATRK